MGRSRMDNKIARKKQELRRLKGRLLLSLALTVALAVCCTVTAYAASVTVDLGSGDGTGASFGVLEALLITLLLALVPSLLLMMTCFTRIIIVLSFLRNALGTQQSPPNQVLVGLALFLTLFIMWPTFTEINETAYQPYRAGELTSQQALDRAETPLKGFMIRQVYANDLNLFLTLSNQKTGQEIAMPDTQEGLLELDMQVVVPAFITSELKRAFMMGFLIYIPFLIIDMVVSSTLMSMGMVMLPPSMISLPFKIMMFVLVDGWGLVVSTLVTGFH
jgi:flagellar biosynthetic protein FliP